MCSIDGMEKAKIAAGLWERRKPTTSPSQFRSRALAENGFGAFSA